MKDVPRSRTLESLKKEARRWLTALRANDADARARFVQAVGRGLTSAVTAAFPRQVTVHYSL